MRGVGLLVVGLLVAPGVAAGQDRAVEHDPAWPRLLREVDLRVEDLELGAPADWLGHPPPAQVPFLLSHLEAVQREPLHLVALGVNLMRVAELVGSGVPKQGSLSSLATATLLQPRLAGFRGLEAAPPSELPTLEAVLERLGSAPSPGAGVDLPPILVGPVGRLLAALVEAGEAVEGSWDGVPDAVLELALSEPGLPEGLAGGEAGTYRQEVAAQQGDDVARAWALLRLTAAVEAAETDLSGVDVGGFESWRADTRWGPVIVAGTGDQRHDCEAGCLLVLDLGGEDRYFGRVAAARGPERPVALALDFAGDDRYRSGDESQGAGVGGVALLVDFAGSDVYEATARSQGWGHHGYGLLWDVDGRARLQATVGAQGAGLFGGGLLVTGPGAGSCYLLGEGQGWGGPGGVGALVDLGGDDEYQIEADPAINRGRGDYHSQGRVAVANGQGAGVGRRGDLTDGRVWAGGIGLLLELGGDDRYLAGNFAQGVGFWFGTGLLVDAGGRDEYRSTYFSQGSAAHHAAGGLVDRGGSDRYMLSPDGGAGLGYGWDFALGLLVDEAGDDEYLIGSSGLGAAARRSVGLFLELGGADRYRVEDPAGALGWTDANPQGGMAEGVVRAAARSNQVGLFVDFEGVDRYLFTGDGVGGDGRVWRRPATRRSTGTERAAGLDRSGPPSSLAALLGQPADGPDGPALDP